MVEKDLAIGGVVVHHQNPQPGQIAARRERFVGLLGKHLDGDLEPESRSLPLRALEADLALHQIHQLTADREPEPGPAEAACQRAIGLGERIEDLFLVARRNADAGVRHGEQEHAALAPVFAARILLPVHAEQHLALLGELDRVADQVHQDLSEPDHVGPDRSGYVVVDEARQLETLALCLLGEEVGDVLDRFAQVERARLELELARLRPREVEDVADQAQQDSRRLVGGLGESPLSRGQLGFEKKLGHAEHAVHRRADLVAHVRQELGLGAVRLLGLPGQLDGLLGPLLQLECPLLDLGFEGPLVVLDLVAVVPQTLEHDLQGVRELAHFVPVDVSTRWSKLPSAMSRVSTARLRMGCVKRRETRNAAAEANRARAEPNAIAWYEKPASSSRERSSPMPSCR